MTSRASTAIVLAFIGSVGALGMYNRCNQQGVPTTRPSSGWHGSHFWWGGTGFRSGSSSHSFTSRGGFGGHGHAMGS